LKEGPYTLALSAGFFGFFAHTGVVSVLEEEGLLPAKLCGASAGALVSALWASGVPASSIEAELRGLKREDFWDPAFGAGLLRGELFRQRLERALPVHTFAECRTPVALSVFDMGARKTEVLREGSLIDAVRASCSLPMLFHPVRIGERRFVDGGVLDRPGWASAGPDERVLLHYLTSRSPWRVFYGPAQKPKPAPHRVTIALAELPRVGPFSLGVGSRAFAAAQTQFREALGRPLG